MNARDGRSRSRKETMSARCLGLLLVVGLFACSKRTNEILVINEPWNFEQAKADCESRAAIGVPLCNGSAASEIRTAEAEISDAFRADPSCSGISLVTLNVSTSASRVAPPDSWWLFLELNRGQDQWMRWIVAHKDKPDARYSLTGNGGARQAAHDACRFIRGEIGAP
jgi:hypothetical protein